MKKLIVGFIFSFVPITIVISQTKDNYYLYRNDKYKFQFEYSDKYKIERLDKKGNYFLLKNKDDKNSSSINFYLEKLDSMKFKESYNYFVKRVSSNLFDSDGPKCSTHGESINAARYFENKSKVKIIEIYENVVEQIFGNLHKTNKFVLGPIYFIDLSTTPTNKDHVIYFRICNLNLTEEKNDKELESELKKIVDSFEFILK